MQSFKPADLSWSSNVGYIYLASPYSKYALGTEAAYADICKIAGQLIKLGICIYSPIAHTHPIAYFADLDELDHNIWLPADRPLMNAASCILVAMLDGWDESFGVKHEIEVFTKAGKPIFYLNPKTMEITETHEHSERSA